ESVERSAGGRIETEHAQTAIRRLRRVVFAFATLYRSSGGWLSNAWSRGRPARAPLQFLAQGAGKIGRREGRVTEPLQLLLRWAFLRIGDGGFHGAVTVDQLRQLQFKHVIERR